MKRPISRATRPISLCFGGDCSATVFFGIRCALTRLLMSFPFYRSLPAGREGVLDAENLAVAGIAYPGIVAIVDGHAAGVDRGVGGAEQVERHAQLYRRGWWHRCIRLGGDA